MKLIKNFKYEESLFLLVASLILGFIFWYQISPVTYNQYNSICTANYGHGPKFTNCMDPYWSQYGLNYVLVLVSAATAIFALFTTIYLKLKD